MKDGQNKTQWTLRPKILLCPRIPDPMHGTAPRVVLGKRWWDKTRKKAYASTNYHCQACGVHKYRAEKHQWLEAHELYDTDYLAGRLTYIEAVPLCHYCHNYIHTGRLTALLEKGEVTQEDFDAVMSHGDRVLAESGLVKPPLHSGPMADWSDWKLVIDGKEYPQRYKTKEEWEQAYQ